jgi:hypothetical protein
MEIRHGRMTREEGIELVKRYDPAPPSTLDTYLKFLQISEDDFYEWIEPMRDLNIWEKDSTGVWVAKDSVPNHIKDPGVTLARVPLVPPEERTFSPMNRHLYYSEMLWKNERQMGRPNPRHFHPDMNEFIVL